MMTASHHFAPSAAAYQVPMPRPTDAVGEALRAMYRGPSRATDDMTALIDVLDRRCRS